jgi:hypothetical protein
LRFHFFTAGPERCFGSIFSVPKVSHRAFFDDTLLLHIVAIKSRSMWPEKGTTSQCIWKTMRRAVPFYGDGASDRDVFSFSRRLLLTIYLFLSTVSMFNTARETAQHINFGEWLVFSCNGARCFVCKLITRNHPGHNKSSYAFQHCLWCCQRPHISFLFF